MINKILPKTLFFSVLFIILSLGVPLTKADAAASIKFGQTAVTVGQNSNFNIDIRVNPDSNNIMGSDVTIRYAPADLEFVSATGTYFSTFTSNPDTANSIVELHSYTLSTMENHTTQGTLGTVTFRAKKGSNTSTLSFACTTNGHDTTIYTISGANINDCSQSNTALVTFTGAPTSTPVPTNTSTPTNTPRPGVTVTPTNTPVPGGGNTVPTCAVLTANITTAVGAPQAISLSCTGNDPDGYINAAQFTFGDGTSQTIKQNVGSPGTITTTHTYTTIGSLGASCIVQDNNNAWSNSVDRCKTTIAIQPTPSPAPKHQDNYIELASAPVPTPEVVTIITDTPEPTMVPETPSPIVTVTPTETGGSGNNMWWILGGIGAIILAYLLLRRKNPPPPKNPPVMWDTPMGQSQPSPESRQPPPPSPAPESPQETVHLQT